MEKELIINATDKLLIDIDNIKDIEIIDFKELVPNSREDRITILPSLYVTYDGGKTIFLSASDKYFDALVKKVFQVYNLEKDKVVVDPQFDPFQSRTKIKINDRTKMILESGDLTKINEIYSFYEGKKSYQNSLLFQCDEIRILLPIIKYHLKQIFDCTDRVIKLDENTFNGYRKNYTMFYKMDGTLDMLLFNFISHGNNETSLYIRSKVGNFKPIEMRIKFDKFSIDVSTYFKDYDLFSNGIYEVKTDNKVTSTFSVHKGKLPIVFKKEELSEVNNPLPNISELDSNDDLRWFSLPWNALYGVNNRVQNLSEVEEIVMQHNKYLTFIDDEFMIKEYASKEYRRSKTFDANANKVVLDEVNKRIYGLLLIPKENIYLMETYFSEAFGSNGYYDAYLKEQYFYHIAQNENRLLGLNRCDLVGISQDDNIIKSADLLATDDVKKLLKR